MLGIFGGRIILEQSNAGRSADRPALRFHGKGRNGKRHVLTLAPCGSIRVSMKICCCPYVSSRSDCKSAQHKKFFSGATWIFCMEPIFFGIIKGEQPLIRASRASKVAGAFLVLFWHAKENVPGGNAFCKRCETQSTRKRSAREAPLSGYMPRQLNNFNKK